MDNKLARVLWWLSITAVAAGWAVTALGAATGNVFREIASQDRTAAGNADITVSSSLKFPAPSDTAAVGGTLPSLQLEIDGQAATLSGSATPEKTAARTGESERGDGIRVEFMDRMELKAGTHRLKVAIPGERVLVEKRIELAPGSRNWLLVEPVYAGGTPEFVKKRPADFNAGPRFYKGIAGVRLWLNGVSL